MKNVFLAALLFALLLFAACLDSTDANNAVDYESRVDTLVVRDTLVVQNVSVIYDTVVNSSLDTVVHVDSVVVLDTIVQLDTLVLLDTLVQLDSAYFIADTLVIKDTLVKLDTLVIKDTLVQLDTLVKLDTLVFKDTIFSVDTLVIKDTLLIEEVKVTKDTLVKIDTLYIQVPVENNSGMHDAVGYWVKIRDVLEGLKSDEKVVIFIRHAERSDDTSENGGLNDNGKAQARALGQALNVYGDFACKHSHFKRAAETCQLIVEGKGQSEYVDETIRDLYDAWYVYNSSLLEMYKNSNGGGWKVFSRWAYTGHFAEAFKNLNDASQELMDLYLVPSYAQIPKYTIAVSHDQLLVPFAAWATSGLLDLRYYETNKWLNYMSGVAMVVSPNGHIRYIPVYPDVNGLNKGTM